MPKLWSETVEAHRHAVREAALDRTAALVAEHGVSSVTMSRIARATGIGRATLYKYFPDVESILAAWHQRQVHAHLEQLVQVSQRVTDPVARLRAVMRAYALIAHQHHGGPLAGALHAGEQTTDARRHLTGFVQQLITEARARGDVRDDVAAGELAVYCIHALDAAAELPSKAAVDRLVDVTVGALRRPG